MPTITINGRVSEFQPGQVILQVANQTGTDIPQYCYHDGLSIVASCRICLAEVWMPSKQTGKLEPYMGGKLLPTCQTACIDGMVVYTDSPKSVANQKAVMEYLLINHPLDCPVCDQAGECFLQDYSYEYGRGVSRFEETKVKNPKKDLGPHIYLYADRCIMCTRCVRFTREVTGTRELLVTGRGNREEIDVFPGQALDNPLSANVADLCPVGALLDKDFLFAQRVWFLKSSPSIDGITASGDNIYVEHNEGKVYRIKPRTNMAVNKWWISDEIRYTWKFVHAPERLSGARRRQFGVPVNSEWERAYADIAQESAKAAAAGRRTALILSPMLPCEEAGLLAKAALALDPRAMLAMGPVPHHGSDQVFPPGKEDGYRIYAEKCPNARGVRRVLEAVTGAPAISFEQAISRLRAGECGVAMVTGNYPSQWATPELMAALEGVFTVAIDTLESQLTQRADVVLASATWVEKAGAFENARGMLQAFEAAIPVRDGARAEGQIALDLLAAAGAAKPGIYNAAAARQQLAQAHPALAALATETRLPAAGVVQEPDMAMVEL